MHNPVPVLENDTHKLLWDFDIHTDHLISVRRLDLARELKKLWNMKVTIVPILIGAFGTITKELLKCREDLEVGGRVETIQMTALLKTTRILRRVLETCCQPNSNEKPSANTYVRNSKGVNNNNNNNSNNNNNLRITRKQQ